MRSFVRCLPLVLVATASLADSRTASAAVPVNNCKSYYACLAQEEKLAKEQAASCAEIKREDPHERCGPPINPVAVCSQQFTCSSGPEPITTKFDVVALYYAPPGNGSTVQYEADSISGTTKSVSSNSSTAFSVSIDVKAAGLDVGGSVGGTSSTGTSNGFQLKTTVGDTLNLQSTSDAIDHGHDVIFLWFNPTMVFTWPNASGPQMQFVPPSSGDVQDYFVYELLGRQPLPDCSKATDKTACQKRQADFASLTPSDKQQILGIDPYVYAGRAPSVPDPSRFVPIRNQQTADGPLTLQGPDNPGDPELGGGLSVTDEDVASHAVTSSDTVTAGLKFGIGGDFLGIFGASVTQTYTWSTTNSSSFGSLSGFADKATVTPKTSTVGYSDLIDVYEDALMHAFLFVSESNGNGLAPGDIVLSGTITKAGQAVAGATMAVVLPGGQKRVIHTNARGVYRIYRAPAGRAQIVVDGRTEYENIVAGRKTVHDVRL